MPARNRNNVRYMEAVEKYIQRITAQGQSETSIRTADYALTRLMDGVRLKNDPNPFVHLITVEMMDDYCYGPKGLRTHGARGKPIKAISFNRYRSVLVSFFDYCLSMRWVDVNPMDGIAPARPDPQQPRLLLSATELMALPDLCTNPVQRIAVVLGMNTGLRANDLRRLTVFDANLAAGTLQTEIRKTRKMDLKPITADLAPELTRWFDEYARLMGLASRSDLPNDWLILPSYRTPAPVEVDRHIKPKPLQMHTHLERLVHRPLQLLGYPTKGEGFHTLRRSAARALFESLRVSGEGRDHALMIVKDFLNHSSVTMTEHYLGLNAERTIRDHLLKDKPFLSALANKEQEKLRGADERDSSGDVVRRLRDEAG